MTCILCNKAVVLLTRGIFYGNHVTTFVPLVLAFHPISLDQNLQIITFSRVSTPWRVLSPTFLPCSPTAFVIWFFVNSATFFIQVSPGAVRPQQWRRVLSAEVVRAACWPPPYSGVTWVGVTRGGN